MSGGFRFGWTNDYTLFFTTSKDLIRQHWLESGSHRDVLQFNPDHDLYQSARRAGLLHILMVSAQNGDPAGYFIMFVTRHPRDKDVTLAQDDALFILPEHRRARLGIRMYREVFDEIGRLGVNIVNFRAKPGHEAFLRRYGLEKASETYTGVVKTPIRPEVVHNA